MFNRDDTFLDPSISNDESSVRKNFHSGNPLSTHNSPFLDEFSFKLNYSHQLNDKSQTQYQSSNSTLSLRQNLEQMQKHDIIELLLEQVKYSQQIKQKTTNLINQHHRQQQLDQAHTNSKQQIHFKIKYQNLVKDFEEYISNTREAQQHFVKTIDELKKENRNLKTSFTNSKKQNPYKRSQNPNSSQFNKQNNTNVQKLQQTIEKYLEINNELIGKVQKLERLKNQDTQKIAKLNHAIQKLQLQCDTLDKENENLLNQNNNFRAIIEELKLYIKQKRQAKDILNSSDQFLKSAENSFNIISQRMKHIKSNRPHDLIMEISQIQHKPNHVLNCGNPSPQSINKNIQFESNSSFHSLCNQQILDLKAMQVQNNQLKETNLNLEDIIEKKSQKIRKLLEQIQMMSQEKLMMKREILKLKNLNKESPKGNSLKESQNIDEASNVVNLQKMVSSSIYSLKNSQSTCLQTSKGPKIDENRRPEFSQKRSAIRQAYNNCFKKQSDSDQSDKKGSGSKMKSEMTKTESSYMPKVLNFSNKKSQDQEKCIQMFQNSPKSNAY